MVIFKERRAIFDERRKYIISAMRALGFEVPAEPDGAFYVYLDCTAVCAKLNVTGSTQLAQKLLVEAHVCLVPGADFGSNQPERYMRLSYATELSQLKEAVRRIGAIIEASS
jgi:aspartate/methionine/tyrosine aminotransferase